MRARRPADPWDNSNTPPGGAAKRVKTMNNQTTTLSHPIASTRIGVAALVFLMGAVLIFGTGFASPQALHDAAHDSRHAMSFPCH